MVVECSSETLDEMKETYPEKFVPEKKVFSCIHRGAHLFIGTGCGEPQYLVGALADFVSSHPKAFFDAEVLHVWTLGVAPYADDKFKRNFRHNSFFIGDNTRDAKRGARRLHPHLPVAGPRAAPAKIYPH